MQSECSVTNRFTHLIHVVRIQILDSRSLLLSPPHCFTLNNFPLLLPSVKLLSFLLPFHILLVLLSSYFIYWVSFLPLL